MAMNGKRYLTINVDASFKDVNKWSGVGAYFVYDTKGGNTNRIEASSKIKASTSSEAEMLAIVYGLFTATQLNIHDVDVIVINSDCQHAINVLNGKTTVTDQYKPAMEMYLELRQFVEVPVVIKKVKAHTNNRHNSPREWVNNKVDELAKAAQRKANANG